MTSRRLVPPSSSDSPGASITWRDSTPGEALINALEQRVPDIILLDLSMPGLSGLETLKTIRVKAPRSLIIVLAAHPSVQEAVDAMKLGADDFVVKTVDLENLDHVVDRALGSVTRQSASGW